MIQEGGQALQIPGLRYFRDFVQVTEEQQLIEELEKLDWDRKGLHKKRGHFLKRREIDYIHDYDRDKKTASPGAPLAAFLEPFRARCAEVVGIEPAGFQQVMATLYGPGAAFGQHIDSPIAFGQPICGISLASDCVMTFSLERKGTMWPLHLERRSLMVLEGPARWNYLHGIPVVKATRYSITMRTLKESKETPHDID